MRAAGLTSAHHAQGLGGHEQPELGAQDDQGHHGSEQKELRFARDAHNVRSAEQAERSRI